jgi:hypothetical protein
VCPSHFQVWRGGRCWCQCSCYTSQLGFLAGRVGSDASQIRADQLFGGHDPDPSGSGQSADIRGLTRRTRGFQRIEPDRFGSWPPKRRSGPERSDSTRGDPRVDPTR